MAFIGQAIVKLVADNLVRITGVELSNFLSGTIGLFEHANIPAPPDVRLPDDFKPRDYDLPDVEGGVVTLQDSVQCWFVYLAPGPVLQPISVVKTGLTPQDFLITLMDTVPPPLIPDPPLPPIPPTPTGPLEIYIKFH